MAMVGSSNKKFVSRLSKTFILAVLSIKFCLKKEDFAQIFKKCYPNVSYAYQYVLNSIDQSFTCIASKCAPEWLYLWISTRDTTPLVTLTLSPPVGNPTTMTSSSSWGMSPKSRKSKPSQKLSSATPIYK